MLIHYLTGSRADFGLMERCLTAMDAATNLDLELVVTGQHLSAAYGETVQDIRTAGFTVAGEIPVQLSGSSGAEMGLALSDTLAGLIPLWQDKRPDLVLLLGDRGEMVAGALAAVHLGIHVAHLHGGERTGTLDESFRHTISKLAHIHLPATQDAADRLVKLGEPAQTVHVVGAPGLVGVAGRTEPVKSQVQGKLCLNADHPLALCLFHPVVQEQDQAAKQMQTLVETTRASGYALFVLRPNSDAGGQAIDAYLDGLAQDDSLRCATHLERSEFLDVMGVADLMIGNSSSGIIESASFKTPCVNIGSRQDLRQRNPNTFDCREITPRTLKAAIEQARSWKPEVRNVYGNGQTDKLLVKVIKGLDLDPGLLQKSNTY